MIVVGCVSGAKSVRPSNFEISFTKEEMTDSGAKSVRPSNFEISFTKEEMTDSDDASVIEDIREKISDLEGVQKAKVTRTLELSIRCRNGKSYTTRFEVDIHSALYSKSGEEKVHIYNLCISVDITNSVINTIIRANTAGSPCFTPHLQSDAPDTKNRMTTTDVLQVLKTKLLLMIPECDSTQIILEDAAHIQGVAITPYRILRGDDALYSKYGYTNEKIKQLRSLLTTMTVGDLETVSYIHAPDTTMDKFLIPIFEKEGIRWNKDELVTELMKKLSFEFEKNYAVNNNRRTLSADIMDSIDKSRFPTFQDTLIFNFDAESPGWREWSQNVVITGYTFTPVKKGGKRKTQRKTRAGKKRSIYSRLE